MSGACAGRVVVLNGAPYSGKEAIQSAVMNLADECWYALGVDQFCRKMLPPLETGKRTLTDPLASRTLHALHLAISATARCGCNLLVDHAIFDSAQADDLTRLLDGLDVVWVGVRCGTDTLRAREAATGPRAEGTALDVASHLWEDLPCALHVDGEKNAEESAVRILAFLAERPMIVEPLARVADPHPPFKAAARPGTIVVLSGTSSAGKSTLARAIQHESPQEFLEWGLDNVYQIVSPRYFGIPLNAAEIANPVDRSDGHLGVENVPMQPLSDPPGPRMWQRIGPVVRNSASGQYAAVAALARAGYDVISDQVFYYEDWYREATRMWADLPVRWVYVGADPAVLVAHERERGDRVEGVSLGLLDQMFKGIPYDIEIDTGVTRPGEAARLVLKSLGR